jgi:hypothetical protein
MGEEKKKDKKKKSYEQLSGKIDSDPIRNFPFSSEDVIQIFDDVSIFKKKKKISTSLPSHWAFGSL